jgi:dipeptidyl aminopeptidase/acylaminoacyl peptidase
VPISLVIRTSLSFVGLHTLRTYRAIRNNWYMALYQKMKMKFRLNFAFLALMMCGQLLAQMLPAERFFELPAIARAALSPDGKSVALLARVRGRLNLMVYEIDNKKATTVTTFEDQDVVAVHWINDKRLVFSAGNAFDPSNTTGGRWGGLYAIDRDASNFRRLAQSIQEATRSGVVAYRSVGFAHAAYDGSDDAYIFSNERSIESFDVYRINTRTGRRTLLTQQSPTKANGWILDQTDTPRVVIGADRLNVNIFQRTDEQSAWQKVHDADFRAPVAMPVAIDFDGKTVYGFSNIGRDTSAVVQWDIHTKSTPKLLFEHPLADMRELIFDRANKKIAGVRFTTDRVQTHWFDENWRNVQRSLDAALPNAVNLFSPPQQGKRFLVLSYSDRNPGTIYLFDGETRKVEFLFDSRPDIKPELMVETRAVKYAARDGLSIPALLTMPKGVEKGAPLIVIAHGGPWVPGYEWRWDAESQFLASRGFAVLKPNFRGTTGLGQKHFLASVKQWGGTMQDDLTDGVLWLAKQGMIDAKRVCIMGASYGGYAAMQGLVKTPEQYRCGVNVVGVTDLLLFQSITWADYSDSEMAKARTQALVGDAEADRAMLMAHSPARNAEKIIAPVLMFYGGEDRRVPIEHGERMLDALKKAGRGNAVLMETFADEGHGFTKLENRVKTYSMIEAFLKQSLK